MLPSANTSSPPPSPKEEATEPPTAAQPTRRRKPTSPDDPPPAPLKCPRCDSTNTKFCYYNNYSLSQPRHFCKACRRYWTQGGALRQVPVGGGYRRSKRPRSAAETLVPFNPLPDFRLPTLFPFAAPPNLTPASGTLRFSGGIGSPAVLSFSSPYNFSGGDRISSIAGDNGSTSLPPPISSMNLELQWKLQCAGAGGKIEMNVNKNNDEGAVTSCVGTVTTTHMAEKPRPIFFQNTLEAPGATNPHHHSAIAAGSGGESTPAADGGEKGSNEEKENDAIGLNDGGGNQGRGDQYHHINSLA